MKAFTAFMNGIADGFDAEQGRLSTDLIRGQGTTVDPTETQNGSQVDADGLKSLVDRTEGGGRYDTLFGHSQRGGRFSGIDVSRMTLDQLSDFSNPQGEYGQWVKQQLAKSGQNARVATPMGRYQIVGTTLRNTARQMGLSGDTVFSRDVQDRMFDHLAGSRLRGSSSMAGKMEGLRNEWEGFRGVSDAVLSRAILKRSRPSGRPMGLMVSR